MLLCIAMVCMPELLVARGDPGLKEIGYFLRMMRENNLKEVHRLLDAGMNPDIRNPETQESALMIAAYHGNVDAMKFLLAAGADLDYRNAGSRSRCR
jgi:ankyrin repeat protein